MSGELVTVDKMPGGTSLRIEGTIGMSGHGELRFTPVVDVGLPSMTVGPTKVVEVDPETEYPVRLRWADLWPPQAETP